MSKDNDHCRDYRFENAGRVSCLREPVCVVRLSNISVTDKGRVPERNEFLCYYSYGEVSPYFFSFCPPPAVITVGVNRFHRPLTDKFSVFRLISSDEEVNVVDPQTGKHEEPRIS